MVFEKKMSVKDLIEQMREELKKEQEDTDETPTVSKKHPVKASKKAAKPAKKKPAKKAKKKK